MGRPRLPVVVLFLLPLLVAGGVTASCGGRSSTPVTPTPLPPGEVWLTGTGGDGAPRRADISAESMFWLDADATMRPAGRVLATTTIEGVPYDLYRADAGTGGAAWTYLAYMGPRGRLSGELRVDAFVRDAAARGLVSPAHFVSGVEFGNECAGGTGTTWVRSYEVRVGG